jgi:hypothetical protein
LLAGPAALRSLLTASRVKEATELPWNEVNTEGRTWTCPCRTWVEQTVMSEREPGELLVPMLTPSVGRA